MKLLQQASAVIFGEDRDITDLTLDSLNSTYRLPLSVYGSLRRSESSNEGRWVIVSELPSSLHSQIVESPMGLISPFFADQPSVLQFTYRASSAGTYDIWIRGSISSSSAYYPTLIGDLQVKVDNQILARIRTVDSPSKDLRWIFLGTTYMNSEPRQLTIRGIGGVILDTVVIVPHNLLASLEKTINELIAGKTVVKPDPAAMSPTRIEWAKISPVKYSLMIPTLGTDVVVFSERYDQGWRLQLEATELTPIRGYGMVNVFVGEISSGSVMISFVIQKWVDVGVYVSVASVLVLCLLPVAIRRKRR
jgi:hypothetical protein